MDDFSGTQAMAGAGLEITVGAERLCDDDLGQTRSQHLRVAGKASIDDGDGLLVAGETGGMPDIRPDRRQRCLDCQRHEQWRTIEGQRGWGRLRQDANWRGCRAGPQACLGRSDREQQHKRPDREAEESLHVNPRLDESRWCGATARPCGALVPLGSVTVRGDDRSPQSIERSAEDRGAAGESRRARQPVRHA